MDKRTKALFEWAASNSQTGSTGVDPPVAPSTKLDSSIIDSILGPDDSQLMLESMQAIKDTSLDLDDRLTAFDNLELLVEQIDNATNLEVLKLWPPLLSLLSAPETSLRRYAAWVTGTAVQNNAKSQAHLLQYKGVKKLVEKLDDEYPVRTKALYALGSALNHFPDGMKQFSAEDGWKKLRKCIDGVEEGTECQRRVAFFLSNYLAEHGISTTEIEENGFLEGFVEILADDKYAEASDLIEKTLQAVAMLVTKHLGTSDKQTVSKLKSILPKLKSQHPEALDGEQWSMLETSLQTL